MQLLFWNMSCRLSELFRGIAADAAGRMHTGTGEDFGSRVDRCGEGLETSPAVILYTYAGCASGCVIAWLISDRCVSGRGELAIGSREREAGRPSRLVLAFWASSGGSHSD